MRMWQTIQRDVPQLLQRRGMVLITSYLVVAVLLILQSAYFTRIVEDHKLSLRHVQHVKALHYADAGLDRAFEELRNDGNYPGTSGAIALGTGAYDIDVTTHPADSSLRIVDLIGYYPDPSANPSAITERLQALVRVDDDLFSWGMFGDDKVDMVGNITLDGYNSNNGPYAGANRGLAPADLGTNSIATRAVDIVGGLAPPAGFAAVTKVYCGVGGNPATCIRITGSANIIGRFALDEQKSFPTILIPPPPYTPTDLPITGGTWTFDPTDPVLGPRLFQAPNAAPGEYVAVLRNFAISGNAVVRVGPNVSRKLIIYVQGALAISGTVVVGDNVTHKAPLFVVYHAQNTANCSVSLGGGMILYGAVYTPNCEANISGGATFYGAAVGETITGNGTVVIHYDQALDITPGTAVSKVELVTWTRQ